MPAEETALLVGRYLDDSLASADRSHLAQLVGDAPPVLQLLLKHVRLANALAAQRRISDLPAKLQARLAPTRESRRQQLVPAVRAGLATAVDGKDERAAVALAARRRRTAIDWLGFTAAAAALVLSAYGVWRWNQPAPVSPVPTSPMAVLSAAADGMEVVREGAVVAASVGTTLQPGDRLTAVAGGVAVTYADGSRLRLDDGTKLVFGSDPDGAKDGRSAKMVRVQTGGISAAVAPQPAGLPMRLMTSQALAEVVGTEFSFAVEPTGSRLSVSKGLVALADGTGRSGTTVSVPAGQQALAGPGHAPEIVAPFDDSRLVAKLLDGCDGPDVWGQDAVGKPMTVTVCTDQPASGSGCLRFAFVRDQVGKHWGSRPLHYRMTAKDRAVRFRMRVEAADPRAAVFVDVSETDEDVWRIAEWPVAAGGGWRTIVVPIPPPERTPRVCEHGNGIWQQERVNRIFFGCNIASATVCIDTFEVLSEP